ncbi:MAG TPA: 2OG-Fe(II) oxygenase, partial [Pyrinomonadaceae bacterium]|nr:2OG-Fe(II) oxygenase [Pyrinomonadaceae bacterium]
ATDLEGKSASIYPAFNVIDSAMVLLLNNPELFKVVEQITGCGHIGCLRGRIYRIVPGTSHHDEPDHYQTPYEILTGWHTDLNGTRLLALSINLNTEPYEGGQLTIREAATLRILSEVTNPVFGDAVLFRIDERLEHRVADVQGNVPKIAFSGWFESEPDYRALLAKGIARSLGKSV